MASGSWWPISRLRTWPEPRNCSSVLPAPAAGRGLSHDEHQLPTQQTLSAHALEPGRHVCAARDHVGAGEPAGHRQARRHPGGRSDNRGTCDLRDRPGGRPGQGGRRANDDRHHRARCLADCRSITNIAINQYGFGYERWTLPSIPIWPTPSRRFSSPTSRHAAATEAPGCKLDLIDEAPANVALTYHNRISRIVQTNCVECHRDGGVAPFALTTHADVSPHAAMIPNRSSKPARCPLVRHIARRGRRTETEIAQPVGQRPLTGHRREARPVCLGRWRQAGRRRARRPATRGIS